MLYYSFKDVNTTQSSLNDLYCEYAQDVYKMLELFFSLHEKWIPWTPPVHSINLLVFGRLYKNSIMLIMPTKGLSLNELIMQ